MVLFGSCIIRQPDPGQILWYSAAPFGVLLVVLAFRSRPIRRIDGIGAKVKALVSNGFSGPEDNGRLFFAGIVFIVIGVTWLIVCRS